MKAVAVTGKGKGEILEVKHPVPENGQVLIKIHTCLLCTWEQRIFSGESGMDLPFIPGHEASGKIVSIPEGTVTSFKEGDHVVFKTLEDCGHCSFCYQGFNNLCGGKSKKRVYGDIPSSGGLAEYISLDVGKVFPVSDQIPYSTAAFTEPLACCIHSIRRVNPDLGETVLIIGAGLMGMLHLKLSLLRGCRVIVIEPRADRRKVAIKEGAHFTIDPVKEDPGSLISDFTDGEGCEYIFFTASKSSIAEEAVKYLKKMGTIVYYGSFHPNDPVTIDPNKIHYGEYVITGSYSPSTVD
ncbi:MAG: alcohol dehydrogenase catalytic domain-containing protein, partial [Spirochaetales bacterium]|nr:alcohol dehydrogenase catalytic domain-containing protein [Spirochaetales bacterium]